MKEAALLYEELRRSVLNRYSQNYAAGHALVVNRGLVAWMMAWAICHTNRHLGVRVELRLAQSPREVACELTQVLVAMVLGERREVLA